MSERSIDSMAREARALHGERPPFRTYVDDTWRPYSPKWKARQLTIAAPSATIAEE